MIKEMRQGYVVEKGADMDVFTYFRKGKTRRRDGKPLTLFEDETPF